MDIHLPIGSLKTHSGLEPVLRCEPSTYQHISRCHNHCPIGAGAFWMEASVLLYIPSHREDSTYHSLFFTPVIEHWLEWEIAQWVGSNMGKQSDNKSHHEQTPYHWAMSCSQIKNTQKTHIATTLFSCPGQSTCARDRRALQQIALNVHVKHSDLTPL